MTAIKHKKSQLIYTYQLTIKQIVMPKVMFFYEVWLLIWPGGFYLFFQPLCWYNFSPLWTLRVSNSETTAFLKKNSVCGKICCQKFSSNVSLNMQWYIFSQIDCKTLFNWIQNICPWIWSKYLCDLFFNH